MRVTEGRPVCALYAFPAHFWAVRAVLGNLQVCRRRHWATVGDPPNKERLSLLPGNQLAKVAKSLPISARRMVWRVRRGKQQRGSGPE